MGSDQHAEVLWAKQEEAAALQALRQAAGEAAEAAFAETLAWIRGTAPPRPQPSGEGA